METGPARLAGSLIGGFAATQAVLDLCADHAITPEIQIIEIDKVNGLMRAGWVAT